MQAEHVWRLFGRDLSSLAGAFSLHWRRSDAARQQIGSTLAADSPPLEQRAADQLASRPSGRAFDAPTWAELVGKTIMPPGAKLARDCPLPSSHFWRSSKCINSNELRLFQLSQLLQLFQLLPLVLVSLWS